MAHTVVIVEDDRDLNSLIQQTLQGGGFRTLSAFTGAEGIDIVSEYSDAILLLDYMLPDMTGKEMIGTLSSKNFKVPFIVITGGADENIAVEMMKLGARDYILKRPGLTGMLPHIIKKLIDDMEREKKLEETRKEMLRSQSELGVLYRVSSAISQTIDMDRLYRVIFDTIFGLHMFNIKRRGAIFIIEKETMNLVSYIGYSDEFPDYHEDMKVGDCLCGAAAETGEIIVCKNHKEDSRHTITYPGIMPHGHIIVPLRARDKVVGVICLYADVDFHIDNNKLKLLDSIGNQIGIAIENAMLYKETRELSLHDPLTGLANRRMMDIVLERSFAKANRFNHPLSALMLDIDFFKKYNDRYGHLKGDRMLKTIASAIVKEIREIDLAVRYGGEEFFILLPDTSLSEAGEVAERIRKLIGSTTTVTVSLGMAAFNRDMKRKEELVQLSDNALYLAKAKGRNCVEVAS